MFAVLHAHAFALQSVLRHEPDMARLPLAIIDPSQNTPRVIALNAAAQDQGVEEGLSAPQAMARCPQVVLRHRSIPAEEAARDALLQSAHAFSPHVEWTAPGCVTLDMRGLADPGPDPCRDAMETWAARLANAIQALGLATRVGIGPTPGLARHAAAAMPHASPGPVTIVMPSGAADFVAALPVAALDPSPHAARCLHQWGVRSVGDMTRLGQADLAERLGLEAFALWAAASPTSLRPLRHERLPETFAEEAPLDPPVETLEPLLFLLRRFADSLSLRLAAAGKAAGELVLRIRLESGDPLERRLRIPQPTHRADVLFRMLGTHLEGVRTPAPVSGVRLLAEPARPHHHQFGLFESALRDPHQFQETLARLAALLGPDRVGSPVHSGGHRPDQFHMVPPDFDSTSHVPARGIPDILRPVPVRRLRPAVPALVEDQPASRPRPATPSGTPPPRQGGKGAVLSATGFAALLDPLFRPAQASNGGDAHVTPEPGILPFPTSWTGPGHPTTPANPSEPPTGTDATPAGTPGRPLAIRCTLAEGRVHVTAGPVRASGGWWDPAQSWQRIEWDVSVHGRQGLRLAWDGNGWSVEAVMD